MALEPCQSIILGLYRSDAAFLLERLPLATFFLLENTTQHLRGRRPKQKNIRFPPLQTRELFHTSVLALCIVIVGKRSLSLGSASPSTADTLEATGAGAVIPGRLKGSTAPACGEDTALITGVRPESPAPRKPSAALETRCSPCAQGKGADGVAADADAVAAAAAEAAAKSHGATSSSGGAELGDDDDHASASPSARDEGVPVTAMIGDCCPDAIGDDGGGGGGDPKTGLVRCLCCCRCT